MIQSCCRNYQWAHNQIVFIQREALIKSFASLHHFQSLTCFLFLFRSSHSLHSAYVSCHALLGQKHGNIILNHCGRDSRMITSIGHSFPIDKELGKVPSDII